jgi:replicative DNA helicase
MPVYCKALEIFKISRAMAVHFTQDKHVVEMGFSASTKDRYAGDLVTESLQLAPGVASVATAKNQESRLERIRNIRKASRSLKLLCKNLEFSGVRESEFLALLKKEIQIFDKMIADWIQQIRKA